MLDKHAVVELARVLTKHVRLVVECLLVAIVATDNFIQSLDGNKVSLKLTSITVIYSVNRLTVVFYETLRLLHIEPSCSYYLFQAHQWSKYVN